MTRFTSIAASVALSLAVAAPAFANDQLASAAGVASGAFSNGELSQILVAQAEDDYDRVDFIKTYGGLSGAALAGDDRSGAGHIQLARTANVNPAEFTTPELVLLNAAIRDNDDKTARFYLSHENRAGDGSCSSAGHVQLARGLDVDPAAYSTNQLLRLKVALEGNDDGLVRFILSQAS